VATIRCPICQQPFDTDFALTMPFCSERCRQVDLGRWLSEEYSVPVEPNQDEFADAAWDHETQED